MKRLNLSLLLVAGFIASASLAHAQTYDISWHVVAGGGGTSSGGNYSVSGTIGQSDAGYMSGGNYSLTGGFWGIISAVQTPGAPVLTIAVASTPNHVIVSWPSSATGFVLQQDGSTTDNSWLNVNTTTFPIVVVNGMNTVTVPVNAGNLFFRLTNP